MYKQTIIVIGASSGGFEAIKKLAADLPPDLPAAVFVVWHMSPDVRGVLPQVLSQTPGLPAEHARDREKIEKGRIYVAPPDHHMILEGDCVRVTRGPRENRFRPAIDPLFRSAAYLFGENVIGIILSGALDDGTSGLWTVKECGGIAIVQDPNDAEVPSMPENAISHVRVDYTVPIDEMAKLIIQLMYEQQSNSRTGRCGRQNEQERLLRLEIGIAGEELSLESGIMNLGDLSPFTCPECHGVLAAFREGSITRYRCHTGHAFTADTLLVALTGNIEESLWTAMRGVDESVILLNHLGDHLAELNQPKLAGLYFQKAREAQHRNRLIRDVLLTHENLSLDSLRAEADIPGDDVAVEASEIARPTGA